MLGKYSDLINDFKNVGYKDIYFNQLKHQKSQIIIRHDIDFDCEQQLGAEAIYYDIYGSAVEPEICLD